MMMICERGVGMFGVVLNEINLIHLSEWLSRYKTTNYSTQSPSHHEAPRLHR